MLNSKTSVDCPALLQGPIKAYEIVFIWLVVTLIWNVVLTQFGSGVPNLSYLEWGGVALTMVAFSKYLVRRENLSFEQFMGKPLPKTTFFELFAVLCVSVLIGVACWALLVLLSAKIGVEWAYSHWNLLSPAEFEEVKWLPSWLIIDNICGIIIVPITEEIVFRGFVLRRLREKYKLHIAILLSSLLFAAFHIDQSFIGSFVHGIVFALLAVRFSSLYAPIIVHSAYNASVSLLQRAFGVCMIADKSRIDSISYWLPELILLVICAIALLAYFKFCLHKTRVVTEKIG
jgi:membrane protease YdiL (CAAX protease family)